MGSPIVHFEIVGKDYENLEKFYSRLFGWKIDKADVGGFTYGFIGEGEAGALKGGIRHEPEGPAGLVVYFAVENVEESVKLAERMGAKAGVAPRKYGDMKFALVHDPEASVAVTSTAVVPSAERTRCTTVSSVLRLTNTRRPWAP